MRLPLDSHARFPAAPRAAARTASLTALASIALLAAACAPSRATPGSAVSQPSAAAHPYRATRPLTDAVLFAEGEVNTPGDEYGPAFTPDGRTIYYVTRQVPESAETIVSSTYAGGRWSAPATAPFSGRYYDKEPFVTPDGAQLFFASRRPAEGDTIAREFDIWMVERSGAGWGTPKRVGPAVNTDEYENYPSVTASGTLYFSRRDPATRNDLYRAPLVSGGYPAAEKLGPEINTMMSDADPYIAPDERYMIFSSTRPGGFGSGDLYVTYRQSGAWTPPRNLGPKVNTPAYEYTPLVSPDGRYLFFTRGGGEIWQIERSAVMTEP